MAIRSLEPFRDILAVQCPVLDRSGRAWVKLQTRVVNLDVLATQLVLNLTTILKAPLHSRVRELALDIIEKFENILKQADALTENPLFTYFYQIFEVGNQENPLLKKLQELSREFCKYTRGQFMYDFCFTPSIRGSYAYCEEVCVDPDEEPWWILKKDWLRRHLGGIQRPLDPFRSIPELDSEKHLSFDHFGNCLIFLWGSWVKLDDLTRECIPVLTGMFAVQNWDVNQNGEIVLESQFNVEDLKLAEAIVLQLQALYKVKAKKNLWSLITSFLPRAADSPEEELARVWKYLKSY